MSDISKALKRWFGLPEINFKKVPGVGEELTQIRLRHDPVVNVEIHPERIEVTRHYPGFPVTLSNAVIAVP